MSVDLSNRFYIHLRDPREIAFVRLLFPEIAQMGEKIAPARLLFPQIARMGADGGCVIVCVDLRNPREKNCFCTVSISRR
jgi:hypothetical protein